MQKFEMVSETAVHQRYLTVYDRRIKFCAHDNPAEVRCLHISAFIYECFHQSQLATQSNPLAALLCRVLLFNVVLHPWGNCFLLYPLPASIVDTHWTRAFPALQCRVLDFDVVGHPRANFCFAVTFPFHPYKDGRKGGEVR